MINVLTLCFSKESGGLQHGCAGAINGWIVRIRKPHILDNVSNPGSFFSRKGFFGLNVVAFVDCKKRIFYRVIKSRGAEHDSTAFKSSRAYKFLTNNWAWLLDRGFYLIRESAYAIRSFLVTPYDNVHHSTPEDDYNFFHSGLRICFECAFGEVDLRFGILWQRLQFSLANNVRVVDACLCLHSFIIDFREGKAMSEIERDVFDEYFRRFFAAESGVGRMGVVGGEE